VIDRRRFLLTSLAGAFAVPLTALGQTPRVGVLMFMPMTKDAQEDFRLGLREQGYIDGQNVQIEWRSAEGRIERANALAEELVRLRVSIIVAEFTPAAQAAKKATQTIPIVLASAGDPVATGLVASLARPGGNVTGFTNLAAELSGKRLELLREIMPGLTRVGLLIHGTDPLDKAFVEETRTAAAHSGIQVRVIAVPRAADLDAALAGMAKERVAAVIIPANLPLPIRRITDLTVRYRLPSISLLTQFAEAGGLMSYGASVSDIRRRTGSYVDKILRGAKPADLPVEQPTKFELVINLRTAKTLALTIPPSLLARADQVIE
jgi:putative tryptophan/tyrosine transport system substrate-binding protein